MSRLPCYLWAFPNTALGLACWPIALITGGQATVVRGVLEIQGGAVRWMLTRCLPLGSASAMTLGHVILGQDQSCLDCARDHEHVHVRQCERWGPLFLPAYLAASLFLYLRGRDPYFDNPFEREAYGCR